MGTPLEKKKKGFTIPHSFWLLFAMVTLAALLTYIVPAGQYDMVETASGSSVVDPTSFHYVERTPVSLLDWMLAVPTGMSRTSTIIIMLLLAMAGIQVLNESKAINSSILAFVGKNRKLELPLIALLAIVYGCIAGFAGWNIEFVPFIPITCAILNAMGYDTYLGLCVVVFPAASGWSSGIVNVFSTAIIHGLADLPIFSGWEYRLVCFIVFMIISLIYILGYAKRYKRDTQSAAGGEDADVSMDDVPEFNTTRKVTLIVSILGIIFLTYCTTAQGWGLLHVGGFWVVMGILLGLINRMPMNEIVASFGRGIASMSMVYVTIGTANAVLLMLEKGQLLHTIVHGLVTLLADVPTALVGVFTFIIITFFNGLTSGVHGKAAMLIPILAPMADILGVNRQIIVLAFIFGDGFTNWFWPTASIAVASTGAAKMDMGEWMKRSWKMFVILSAAAAVLVFIAYFINYS